MLLYDACGKLVRIVHVLEMNKSGALIGGVCVDGGRVLTTVTEPHRTYVGVSDYARGQLEYVLDSHGARLRRPSGICLADGDHCLVADLANHCVKKFRFK